MFSFFYPTDEMLMGDQPQPRQPDLSWCTLESGYCSCKVWLAVFSFGWHKGYYGFQASWCINNYDKLGKEEK